jgi:hypothetical protein
MAENSKRSDRSSAAEFSDDVIRRFLLGRLLAAERPVFEEQFLIDDVLTPRVRLTECELADDYAFGRLNSAERELFEKKFLVSADRKQKLRVSSALRDRFRTTSVLAPGAPQARTDVFEKLKGLFAPHQPAWRFAFGIVTLLLLIATVWLVVKEPRIKEGIKQRILARRPPAARATRETSHPEVSPVPAHQTAPAPQPDHSVFPPQIITVVLSPAPSFDSGKTSVINLPKDEHSIIRFQLAVDPNRAGPYRAEVLSAEGQSVFNSESPKATGAGATVDVDVPSQLLRTGDYQIRLRGVDAGLSGSQASYYFRVP